MRKWLKRVFGNATGSSGAVFEDKTPAPEDESIALRKRGDRFYEQKEFGQAEACYREAIEANPRNAEAYNVLGNTLYFLGRHSEAIEAYQSAINLRPDWPDPHNNLGNLYDIRGYLKEAIACYQNALALNPGFAPQIYCNMGSTYHRDGKLAEAVDCYRKAIALKPDYAAAHTNLGTALTYLGRDQEALESYRTALALDPNDADARSNQLLIMQYFGSVPPSELFERHLQFARQFEAPLKASWPKHANVRDPERRLKVGYVSPDFRSHSVAYFIEPVLENHDKSRVEVFCYYNHPRNDEFTERIKRAADHWIPCVGRSDRALSDKVKADGIDILVDLAGHTSGNRMLTFARKPAPIQVVYLGYQSTTGLAAMDYRLTDRHADPEATAAPLHVERLWYLPATSWCYRPQAGGPRVTDRLPMEGNGYVTLGCLNNFSKVTDGVLQVWARIMNKLPDARLLLKVKGIENREYRTQVEGRLAALGMPIDRVTLIGHQKEHPYGIYNRIDVALDPFPYNGCTTSFDALWMGVPFVTLAGRTSVSRVGVSILTNAGLPELVAATEDDYLAITVALVLDQSRLRTLRACLRERVRSGPLMDAKAMAASLEEAYRGMWKKWCATNG